MDEGDYRRSARMRLIRCGNVKGQNGNILRPLQNAPFCPISVSGSNFNPRNTQCIPAVKIFAFLELKQKIAFFKGLIFFRLLLPKKQESCFPFRLF